MENKIISVIPVKDKSERVESKNFRLFDQNLSLFEFKLLQIINSKAFDEIYISSDSEKAEEIAKNYSLKFIKRPQEFCNNTTPWSEVIHHVVDSLNICDNDHVAWCHTTSPLFDSYSKAVTVYFDKLSKGYNGLISVSAFKEFLVNEKSRPFNYNWGVWHDYSQNLETLYRITGSLFISTKKEMIKNRYVISTKPYLFESSAFEGIDIDTEFDFKLAQLLYQNKSQFIINE
ncbi:MAG: hypothetical protein SFU91_06160 [Chloroherpetonaceae bacterium]|nr:hypothetical protein [Chloroherpetonaceae bacterium]